MGRRDTDRNVIKRIIAKVGVKPKAIQYDQQNNVILLDLSSLGMTDLPEELGQLSNLQVLYLDQNKLTELPRELRQLSNLQVLYLDQNKLTKLPRELGQLSSLRELHLQGNELTELPRELGQLSSLRELYLQGNALTELPRELGELSSLRELYLDQNKLAKLPGELRWLSSLQMLYLDRNKLTELPRELGELSNLQVLYLQGNELTELPRELGELSGLQVLHLQENKLTELPRELGGLSGLQVLHLDWNKLAKLPRELGQLSSLQVLDLQGNELMELPGELGQLAGLRKLDLQGNKLTELPRELGELSGLQELYLQENELTALPRELGELSGLQVLYLDQNELTALPAELGELSGLQVLHLQGNKLAKLPAELGQMPSLQVLDLQGNELTELPRELGQLSNLQELDVSNNSYLLTPPPEIISQGTQAILTFLQELHHESYLKYEAKLILVGEGGTGKSSLLRALHHKDFDISLKTTHGIEVDTLSRPHPDIPNQTLLLNTWDFGGQDIYRATHQFFLTKRSLYLVVWNARLGGEQGKLDYWLNTIRVLAPEAPILLVSTHIDERLPDINEPRYLADYPQIKEVIHISSKTGEGIDGLQRALARHAAKLPLMGQPWPRSWIEVEQELLAKPEHHISEGAYMDLCMKKGVHATLAQGTLGSYLHDLGKILYFRDDPILNKVVILKPNWVTKAISLVLEDTITRDRNGILEHGEFSRIWAIDEQGKSYDPSLYPVFLRLMERFDLCYQINLFPEERSTRSLIPQLLPYHPPSSLPSWTSTDEKNGKMLVKMTYRLDFVPAGIMSWFIVRTHRFTSNLHWREGVLLSYHRNFSRVELFPSQKELRMEVWGIEPRTFLVILKDTIDLILSRFEGLQTKQEVPCICHQKRGESQPCPEVYRYEEDLVKRLERNVETIACRESYEDVFVRDLLYGIHASTCRQMRTVIEENQRELLRRFNLLDYKIDSMSLQLQRSNQLSELLLRHFTRLWNFEMKKMEAECPNIFRLDLESKTSFDPKNWISQNYKLFLMCQYPSGPHSIIGSKGYDLRQTRRWWVKVAPWLKYLVMILNVGMPLIGSNLEIAIDENIYKNFDQEVDLLEKIVEGIPEVAEIDASNFTERPHHVGFEQNIGAALRLLHSFLMEVDPKRYWDGLQKVVTEDGNIFWLCKDHAHPYMVQPLQP